MRWSFPEEQLAASPSMGAKLPDNLNFVDVMAAYILTQ